MNRVTTFIQISVIVVAVAIIGSMVVSPISMERSLPSVSNASASLVSVGKDAHSSAQLIGVICADQAASGEGSWAASCPEAASGAIDVANASCLAALQSTSCAPGCITGTSEVISALTVTECNHDPNHPEGDTGHASVSCVKHCSQPPR